MPSRERREWYSGRPSQPIEPQRENPGGCRPVAVAGVVLALGIVGVAIWLFGFGGVDYFAGPTATAPAPTSAIVPVAAPSATATPTPIPKLPPAATDTAPSRPTASPAPTHTPLPTPSPTMVPTAAPTATPVVPTEREIVVNAFAGCNGQYSGRDKRFREAAADSAIRDGRSTVADIRALVEQYCAGVFPNLPASASKTADAQPTPTATALPTRMATPTGALTPTRPPQTISANERDELPAIDCGLDCTWDYAPLVGSVDWVQRPRISERGILSLVAMVKDGHSLILPGRDGGSSNISLTDGGDRLYGSVLPPAGLGWRWTAAPGQWIASSYEYRNGTLSVTARIGPEAVNHKGLTLCLWTGGAGQRSEILDCVTVDRP